MGVGEFSHVTLKGLRNTVHDTVIFVYTMRSTYYSLSLHVFKFCYIERSDLKVFLVNIDNKIFINFLNSQN